MRDSFYPLYPFLLPHPYSILYHLYSVLYPNPQSRHLSNLHYHHPHPLASSTPSQIHSLLLFFFFLNSTLFTFIKEVISNLLHKGESINLQFFIETTRNLSPLGSYGDIVFSRRGHLHPLGWLIAPSCMEVFWL